MDTITRPLHNGMMIGTELHKDFELRSPLVSDLLAAEKTADPRMIHTFNVELLVNVVTRVGSFTGPFTVNMFSRLKRSDYNAFVNALLEVDAEGEAEPGAPATT